MEKYVNMGRHQWTKNMNFNIFHEKYMSTFLLNSAMAAANGLAAIPTAQQLKSSTDISHGENLFVFVFCCIFCLFVCVSERRLWASGYQRLWYMDGWVLKANVSGLMYWTTRAQPRQIQIHKYTNTQIHKYTNTQIHES